MSGHSKWATIKHKKGAQDKARGKLFAKLIRQVEVAAREGGSDLTANASLRAMVQKARDASVPMDTIDRAIKRGTGEMEGVRYEPITYEGYAPGGVALIVECLSDNRNRTGSEVRSTFTRSGGSMAEPGAVSWQFQRQGVLAIPKSSGTEDDIMLVALEAGADDLSDEGELWQVTCPPNELAAVRQALEDAGVTVEASELVLNPTTVVPIEEEGEARRVLRLIDALEDHDDVQNVYANFDIPDEIIELVEA